MGKWDTYGYQIYLQPQIELDCGKLSGAEVLLRGVEENGELILPNKFIPKMERKRKSSEIDFFVMSQVCDLLKKWKACGTVNIPLSVNLSRYTLSDLNALENMVDLCRQTQVSQTKIVVEITERSTEKIEKSLMTYAKKWMDAGFRLSLDDYGNGFSNMKTLSEIEFSELKIDQSLIAQLNQSKKAEILVKTVVEMCKDIGNIRCIAEGIEQESQVRFLREIGCKYGQGYYFYKPMTVDEFENIFL